MAVQEIQQIPLACLPLCCDGASAQGICSVEDIVVKGVAALQQAYDTGSLETRIKAVHALCGLIEQAEHNFIASAGYSQDRQHLRAQHPIGRILVALHTNEAMYGAVIQGLLPSRTPTESLDGLRQLAGLVAALRLLVAVASGGPELAGDLHLHSVPDIDESVTAWALLDDHKPPAVLGDPAPGNQREMLLEAQASYAIGLLSVLIEDPSQSQNVVRSGVPASVMRYIRRCAEAFGFPRTQLCDSQQTHTELLAQMEVLSAVTCQLEQYTQLQQQHEDSGTGRDISISEAATVLRFLRRRWAVNAVVHLGDYVEALGSIIHERTLESCLFFLKIPSKDSLAVADLLMCIGTLLAHRRVAEKLSSPADMDIILSIVPCQHTADGLSQILFSLSAVQVTFERLTSSIGARLARVALKVLEYGGSHAGTNAALCLSNGLHYPPFSAAFDAQGGLPKLMTWLQTTLRQLRRSDSNDVKLERQLCYHVTETLKTMFRVYLVTHVKSVKERLSQTTSSSSFSSTPRQTASGSTLRFVDSQQPAVDLLWKNLQEDPRLWTAFAETRWPLAEEFLQLQGASLMLDVVVACPGERYCHEMSACALQVLSVLTLLPHMRQPVLKATTRLHSRTGVGVLLAAAANSSSISGSEQVMAGALAVLANCVLPPPADISLDDCSSQQSQAAPHSEVDRATAGGPDWQSVEREKRAAREKTYRLCRADIRSINGIKVLLELVSPKAGRGSFHGGAHASLRVRGLAVRCLRGLAYNPAICSILATLQLPEILSETIQQREDVGRRPAQPDSDSYAFLPGGPFGSRQYNAEVMALISLVTCTGSKLAARITSPKSSLAQHFPLRALKQAAAAAASPLTYEPKQLLQLISDHLRASGLAASAAALVQEAHLERSPAISPVVAGPREATTRRNLPVSRPGPSSDSCLTQLPLCLKRPPPEVTVTGSSPVVKRRRLSGNVPVQPLTPMLPEPVALPQHLPSQPETPIRKHSPSDPSVAVRSSENQTCTAVSHGSSLQPVVGDAAWLEKQSPVSACSLGATQLLHNLPAARGAGGRPAAAPVFAVPSCGGQSTTRSRLHDIVVSHLRSQHESACASASNPISTLAPISLSEPHVIPQAVHSETAPTNATLRMLRRQTQAPHGGYGGRRLQSHLIHSRFRMVRSLRNEHMSLFKCAAFAADSDLVAVGMHSGEIRVYHTDSSGLLLVSAEEHSAPVNMLHTRPEQNQKILMMSSSREEVKLWDLADVSLPSLHTFENHRSGQFDRTGNQIAAVLQARVGRARRVSIFDATTCAQTATLTTDDWQYGICGGERIQRAVRDQAMWSPREELLMWGNQLWDPRTPDLLHSFDSFTSFATGHFNPSGLEVTLNSEVWDLRTRRLIRRASCLDGAVPVYSAACSDVIYAAQRRVSDDIGSELTGRRARHPLQSAFRTVDAHDYSEIATVDTDNRAVLSIAVDSTDSLLAAVTADMWEATSSSVRIYEIGRRPAQADDSSESDDDVGVEDDASSSGDDDVIIDDDGDEDGDDNGDADMDGDESGDADSLQDTYGRDLMASPPSRFGRNIQYSTTDEDSDLNSDYSDYLSDSASDSANISDDSWQTDDSAEHESG